MRVGKFETDFDDGQLLCHASSVYCDDTLSDELLTRLIGVSLSMLDRCQIHGASRRAVTRTRGATSTSRG